MKEVQLAKTRMEEVISRLEEAFAGIHTGRASTTLVEKLVVTSYGQPMPLKAVATIAAPEANQLQITPWDKGQLVQIEDLAGSQRAELEENLEFAPFLDAKELADVALDVGLQIA